MKKFIKHGICIILVLVMFFSIVPLVDASSEEIHYLSIGLKTFFDLGNHNDLLDRSGTAHLYFVEDMRETRIGTLAIKVLSFIYDIGVDESGTEPDEAKYMEVLVNIMKTYEMENADAISEQFQMDNLKGIEGIGWDALEIGIALIPDMSGSSGKVKELGELIKSTMSGLAKVAKNTDGWIEAISNLETLIQDYAKFDNFLALIESDGRGNLKSAASKLRTCMADAMKLRLDTYCDLAESHSVTYTKFFFEDVFYTALKQTDLYDKDSGFAGFVDVCANVNQRWCALNLGKDIGKFIGNIAVGAEDIVNRTLEMKAIYDITEILESELWFIYHTFTSNYSEETDTLVEKYITYGNYLISCRIRGEYCLYSMLAKDSGLASRLDEETAVAAEKQYNRLTTRMAGLKESLDSIPDVLIVDTGSDMPYEAVNATSEWNVYGADGKLYDNYTLRIYDKQSLLNFVHTGPMDEPDPTVTEYVVNSAEPLQVSLEVGYAYSFEFIDNENPEKMEYFLVGVTDSDPNLISVTDVTTNFGKVVISNGYNSILDMYYEGISCNWPNCDGYGYDVVGDPDNVSIIISRYEARCTLSEVGYCLLDINDDAQPELIISMINVPGGIFSHHNGAINDLYTIVDGKIIHVISASQHYRYNLAEDYSINHDGSISADTSIEANYRLDKQGALCEVSRDSLPNNIPLELTPFSEYTP